MEPQINSSIDSDLFTSVYRHDYIYFDDVRRPAFPYNPDTHRLCPCQETKFASDVNQDKLKQEQAIMKLGIEEYEKEMADIMKDRMKSVYMVDYTGIQGYEWRVDISEMLNPENDELVMGAEKLYQPKTIKPIKPLPTARRVMGYCSLNDYFTGQSVYQDTISKLGFKILKKEAAKGGARIGPRFNYEKALNEVNKITKRKDLADSTSVIDVKSLRFVSPNSTATIEQNDKNVSENNETKETTKEENKNGTSINKS